MKSLIIGTAGHVDHGKTALVKALTGIDTDRLKEEKERGISIELGYAPLKLSEEFTLGIVDVPGHESLVKTMVMGATQIDLVLFVIAANEGIKPQTEEHFRILNLLGIQHSICVITKSDLIELTSLRVLTIKIRNHFSHSFLDNAKIIPVSSMTGAGLDTLKQEIFKISKEIVETPSYLDRTKQSLRIPIDRVFTLPGFGTVVTGPLLTGIIHKEDELEVVPLNKLVRVRQIHTYGKVVQEVSAPSRVALNLRGVEKEELERGCILAKPGTFSLTSKIIVKLKEFSAPHIKECIIHTGTSKALCHIRKFKEPDLYSVKFKEPVCVLMGDKFVLRHGQTLGGGEVIDPLPFKKKIRIQINEEKISDLTEKSEVVLQYFKGNNETVLLHIEDVQARVKLKPLEFDASMKSLLDQKKIIRLPKGYFMTNEQYEHIKSKVNFFFKSHDAMTVSDAKDLMSVSRKQAIPYLEFFDEHKWTIRKGDVRIPWKIGE